jgi:hypothetical protein
MSLREPRNTRRRREGYRSAGIREGSQGLREKRKRFRRLTK